jgi:ATP/maltotriose-dependent transcriptional regulator MalT
MSNVVRASNPASSTLPVQRPQSYDEDVPLGWPLVGRQEELEFVERATNRPGTAGAVVAGAPGVGKSRLVREALANAEGAGRSTAWCQATRSGAEIPFAAMAHLLPPQIAGAGRRNLLRMAADAITELSPDGSLLLGIDDAHLLDDHSAALVHLLAETERCSIVATVRTGEAAPDPITVLWKDELAERLELQPLSREEVYELLERSLGSPIDPATRHQLWTATQGNVLFLRELVLGGLETGRLHRARGSWRWRGGFADVPRLSDVLDERLRTLEASQRALLEVVAAVEPIAIEILEGLEESPSLEAAASSGLLEISDGKSRLVRVSHPLYAEALRERMPATRRRGIYRRLAEAVSKQGTTEGHDLLRVATWRLLAGDRIDAKLAVSASRRALSLYDFGLAERLADAGLREGGGWPAAHALAEAQIGQGRAGEADGLLATWEVRGDNETERVVATISRADNLFWHLGRGHDAVHTLESLEATIPPGELRFDIAAARARYLMFGGRTDEGVDIALRQLESHDLPPRAMVSASMTATWGLALAGRGSEGLALAARALPAATTLAEEIPFAPEWIGGMGAAIDVTAGRLIKAEQEVYEGYAQAVGRGAWPVVAAYGTFGGWFERLRGRPRSAKRLLLEAITIHREADLINQLSFALGELALCEALLGDPSAAEAALAEADTARVTSFRMDDAPIGLARAWVSLLHGETSRAVDLVHRTAETTGSMGQRVHEAAALYDLVRLGRPTMSSHRLGELAIEIESALAPLFSDHANASAADDAAEIERVSKGFEDAGAILYAAEAAAEASRLHRRQGRKGSALASAAKARALAELCEGARTPALAHLEADLPLTRREQEIATLAARGLSNREIAERLVVSVRTVDNHLHSAYAKLGVSGRGDLAPILLTASAPSE